MAEVRRRTQEKKRPPGNEKMLKNLVIKVASQLDSGNGRVTCRA